MAQYKIQGPDGKVLTLEGPEGADPEQIIEAAASLYKDRESRIAKDRENIAAQDERLKQPSGGAFQRFREGIGSGMTNVGRRATALMLPEALTPKYASDEAIEEQSRLDKPLTDTTAGTLGKLTGEIAATAPLGAIGSAAPKAGLAGRALLGAVEGGLAGQVTNGDASTGAGIGAAIPLASPLVSKLGGALKGSREAMEQAVPGNVPTGTSAAQPAAETAQDVAQAAAPDPAMAGAQRVAGGSALPGANKGTVTGPQQKALDFAKKTGLKTTPSMQTGSKVGGQVEAALEANPMTSSPFNKIKDHNQERANAIAGEAIGLKGIKSLDEEALGQARDKIGATFDKVKDDRPRLAGDPAVALQTAKGILEDASSEIDDIAKLVPKQANRFLEAAATGTLTGKVVQQLASVVNKAAYQAGRKGDMLEAEALQRFKDSLDDLLLEGVEDPALLKELQEAKQMYRTLKVLESPGVVNSASGNVSAKTLGNVLASKDKRGYFYGGNDSDLYNLARFAKAFPTIADSGTATRMSLNEISNPTALGIAGRVLGPQVSKAYLKGGEAAIDTAGKVGRGAEATTRGLGRTLEELAKRARPGTGVVLMNGDEENY